MKISNMLRVEIAAAFIVVANFDLELDDGPVIHRCAVTEVCHGFNVQLPRRGRRELVAQPTDLRVEFADTALLVFRYLPDNADNSGMRRTLLPPNGVCHLEFKNVCGLGQGDRVLTDSFVTYTVNNV